MSDRASRLLADRLEGRLPNAGALLPLRAGILAHLTERAEESRFRLPRSLEGIGDDHANQPKDSHDVEQRPALATEDVGEGGANRENHHYLNQVREETYRRTTSPGAFKQLRGSLLRLCEAICEFCSFCAR
jgi:hypothetical protein